MSILPEGEQLRKAVKWISERREANPGVPLFNLVGEACIKFDLSPKDEEVLMHFFMQEGAERGSV